MFKDCLKTQEGKNTLSKKDQEDLNNNQNKSICFLFLASFPPSWGERPFFISKVKLILVDHTGHLEALRCSLGR